MLAFLGSGGSRTKGEKLERFFEALLRELQAQNVERQRPGLQFGRDFSFIRWGRSYYAECKNLNRDIAPVDLASKVMWFPLLRLGDYYVIVSPTPLSNALREYFRQNQHRTTFLDWTGDNFFYVCTQAPKTVKEFCSYAVEPLSEEELRRAKDLVECKDGVYPPMGPLCSHVAHVLGTPFMWVYYRSDRGIERGIPLGDASFRVYVVNLHADTVSIDNLRCRIERVSDLPDRILGWAKLKGIVKPPRFTVDFSTGARDFPDLLSGQVLQVGGNGQEIFDLEIKGPAPDGIYCVFLFARCLSRSGSTLLSLEPIPFVAIGQDTPSDRFLTVFGSPRNEVIAGRVLDLEKGIWHRAARAGTTKAQSRYLGVSTDMTRWVFEGSGFRYELGDYTPPSVRAQGEDKQG